MNVLYRLRVDPDLLEGARQVTGQLGTSLENTIRMFMSQIVRTGKIPLSLDVADHDELVNGKRTKEIWRSLDDSTAKDW